MVSDGIFREGDIACVCLWEPVGFRCRAVPKLFGQKGCGMWNIIIDAVPVVWGNAQVSGHKN